MANEIFQLGLFVVTNNLFTFVSSVGKREMWDLVEKGYCSFQCQVFKLHI